MNQKNLLKGSIIALLCVALIAGIVLSVAQPDKPDDDRLSNVETRPTTGEDPTPTDGPDVEPPLGTGPAEPHDPIVPPTVPPVSQPEPKPTEPAPVEPEATEPDSTEPEEPENKVTTLTGNVSSENSTVTEDTFFGDGDISVMVPAGAQLEDNTTSLTLTITEKDSSDSGVQLDAGQTMLPLDVHIEGISAENTAPITISLGTILPKGLNIGNYSLYHVENGVAVKMNAVPTANELTAHNDFVYDPADGNVVISVSSFSEIALVSEPAVWKGEMDFNWYDPSATELYIRNADQLAAFGAIVGNMHSDIFGNPLEVNYEQDSFEGKTVILWSDIDLGDKEDKNNPSIIFYPIGYWNSEQNYKKTSNTISAGFYTFEGTFDGNGNTISNFYQNTWEMKGTHDWYDASLQYYRQGMGLFGKVYGGTVKNLTVDNFSSDGEITTTGVIAAYADSKDGKPAIFENISIVNCNPRVYNIGNGGIVGCAGWYSRNESLGNADYTNAVTFRNITVDQTNKISALWGTYDASCGGILGQYYPDSGCGLKFENCHVAAIMDVNNDVCANYQYYWYRYSGMLMGTVRANKKDEAGYTVANTTGIKVENCTYTYGSWNEYWYCELVKNSSASYTHDYQFGRLTNIKDLSEISADGGKTWLKEGNFAIPSEDRTSVECYHIFKGSNGELYRHFHDVADESNPDIYEAFDVNGDGLLNDLKEDRVRYYLPFGQVLNGLGYGVKPTYSLEGFTEKADGSVLSGEKFALKGGINLTFAPGTTVNLKDLVNLVVDKSKLSQSSLYVAASPLSEGDKIAIAYTRDVKNWENNYFTISEDSVGSAKIVITDYFYCQPTVIEIEVVKREPAEKFNKLFTNENFIYRIGNANAVNLGNLFASDAVSGTVEVTITNVTGNASGAYTANNTWTNGSIKFSGTGKVKVTITDNDYCIATELELEVVDATNATGAASATANNVVLLNDAGFSSLTVSGGYTLYGNGFTLTCGSDSPVLDMGYSFVTLENGTLDNVQIVLPNFDYAALYKSNLTSSDNRSETTDRTRYYNAKSGVMASGNSQILNSRIYGARAAVNVAGGNLLIDNSRIELGAVANILVGAANSLTLRDVTLIQKPTVSTHDSSKVLMGFSVLMLCNSEGNAAPVTLEGTLIQNAWADENDSKYVPSAGKGVVSSVLSNAEYIHDLDADGTKESLNLGFAYMPESSGGTVNSTTITDSRTNENSIPYDYANVNVAGLGKTFVYSFKYSNGETIPADYINTPTYAPNKYGDIISASYADTADGLSTGKDFATDGWVYELNVDLDKLPGYALDFSKLTMSVNGEPVTDYLVNGSAKPSPVTVTTGGVTYTLTTTIDGKEYIATFKVTGTETTKESPSLVASNYAAALLVGEAGNTLTKDTFHGAAPVLEGIQIKYWSVAEKQYKTISLADYTPSTAGKQNGTNNTWTYTAPNGDFTLTITGGQVHSSNKVNAMPVVCNGTLYFVAAGSNGLVNYGNDPRDIPITYSFKDNNGGAELTFKHTWQIACENGNTAWDYSDFCNGTKKTFTIKSSNGNICVTGDTLVTLADGTKKRIDQVTYGDQLLVWNFFTGEYDIVPSAIIFYHGNDNYDVLNLYFDDGTQVKVLNNHGFYDIEENQFVFIDEYNAKDYLGHSFVKVGGNSYTTVKLVGYEVTQEYAGSYSIQTAIHNNFMVEDMFSITMPHYEGWFDYFEIGDNMKYDEEKMQADIEKYGLYTYEDFAEYVTYEQFIAFNGPYLKVLVGRGVVTYDQIIELISLYVNG